MDDLLILGAGGHGNVVAEAALESENFKKISFLDDKFKEPFATNKISIKEIIGSFKDFKNNEIANSYKYAFVALGDSKKRLSIISELINFDYLIPVIRHPSSWISRYSKIGYGSVLLSNSNLQTNSVIGKGVIINTNSVVDHDVHVGDGVHICPGVNIAGNVRVGKNSWIGIGSSILNGISIGSNVTIGAGSVVTKDIPDNVIAKGVPAKWT